MAFSESAETTQLLRAWAGGDERALTELVPRVHRELRHLAGKLMRNERSGSYHTSHRSRAGSLSASFSAHQSTRLASSCAFLCSFS